MRRRQAYALQTQLLKEKARNALLYSAPVEHKEVFAEVKVGGCQYCGKDIKRGLYMHEKHCKAK